MNFLKVSILLITTFILIGCSNFAASAPPEDYFVKYEKKDYTLVPVLVATDREYVPLESKILKVFPSKRGTGEVYYTEAVVSIPIKHKAGKIERPSWFEEIFNIENQKDHIMIINEIDKISKENFYLKLKNRLKNLNKYDILIFIHGYNNNIQDAVFRTAQITYDLELPLIPITYSWASVNSVEGYIADSVTADWSVPHIKTFLKDIALKSEGRKINIIAHSMGNKLFTNAIKELNAEHSDIKFNEIILAAPDVDSKIFFEQIAPAMKAMSKRTTLYISKDDKALNISEVLSASQPRLGQGDNEAKSLLFKECNRAENNQCFETINASGIDTSLIGLNHSFFAEIEIVINDITEALKGIVPKEREKTIYENKKEELWVIKKY